MKIINTEKTRQANQKSVLELLRFHGAMSAADLARLLGVPAGTVARVVSSLSESGLLKSGKPQKATGVGKPPTMQDVNKDFASIAGIELNELSMRLIITDFKGKILFKRSVKTQDILDDLIENIVEVVSDAIEKVSAPKSPLKGLGIGISGLYSEAERKIIQGFLPYGLELPQLLQERLDIPVFVGNDANFAALAEKKYGAGRVYENIICLLDRGWLGSGLFLNNSLYTGKNNAAGELCSGIHSSGKKSNKRISMFPFMESYGLERKMKEIGYSDLKRDDFESREMMIKELCKRAENGDDKALSLIDNEASNFSEALFRLACLFDPDMLFIIGDITAGGHFAEEKIQHDFAEKYSEMRFFSPPDVLFSNINGNGVALGAASMAIEEVENLAIQRAFFNNGDI